MDPRKQRAVMDNEYAAWQTVVREWREIELPDFNGSEVTPLIKAIERWGEYLVRLRMLQSDSDRERAFEDKCVAYHVAVNEKRMTEQG